MSDDFRLHTLTWLTGKAIAHILDFDDPAMASFCAHDVEGLPGVHSVMLTTTVLEGQDCPPEVKARIDAVINGRIGLECGRLRLRVAELEAAR